MTARLACLLLAVSGCVSPAADPWDGPRESRTPAVAPASHAQPATENNKFGPTSPRPDAPSGDSPASPRTVPTTTIHGGLPSTGGALALDEVLDSVEKNYPLLRAAEQERAVAGGRLLSAAGAFDLTLTAGLDGQGTTYDNLRTSAGLSQGLPVGGVGVFAGYRNGYGDFPTYNLGQKTADGGEFRAGVSVPLAQGRQTDRPRAALRQAQLDVQIAEPVIERQRLDFQRAAARTYWGWVAAGRRLGLVENLVKLAADRDEQLKATVEAGRTANVERIDNQQNVALRNGILVQARRALQQATIDLSLFLRDAAGRPLLAAAERLPEFPDVRPIDPRSFDDALQTAFAQRPEPRRLRLQRDKVAVDLGLAANQMLPTVNAVVAASQDVGRGKSSLSGPNGLEATTVSAGVAVQLPVQRRESRGRVQVAQAQAAQLDLQLRHAEDVVRAEVQDTFSALERGYEFFQQARKRVELARTVARAEREQLRLGRSDILRVTLREQTSFDAEVLEVGAQQDYFRALADFRAATGIGGR